MRFVRGFVDLPLAVLAATAPTLSTRRCAPAIAALVVLSLATFAGCVSFGKSDPSRFYLLTSTIPPAPVTEATGRTVGILPVEIPKSVRRPQLVYVAGENEVKLAGFARWAEPLEDGLARVFAADLAALLPGTRIEGFPFPPGLPVEIRVSIHVTDFRLDPAAPEASLTGRWSVYGLAGATPTAEGSWSGTAPAADSTAASLVAAMSRLVGDLAQEAVRNTPAAGGAPAP